MVPNKRRRNGIEGEKMISVPESACKKIIKLNPILSQIYITQIGFTPKVSFHYRDRRNGSPDNLLVYCIRGKGWYMVNGKHFDVGVNQFLILPATKEHLKFGADKSDPWTIYWVNFTGTDMDLFNHSFNIGLEDGPQVILFNEKGLELWDKMYNTLEMGYNVENLTAANMCLYHFIATFLFPEKQINRKEQDTINMVHETVLFMKSHLNENLTVDEIAAKSKLSASHFTHLFKKSTGMSPLEYFIHLKLQRASLLLITTDIKVKVIAEQLGYDDPYYFSRIFKKYMQVSPEQYRLFIKRPDAG